MSPDLIAAIIYAVVMYLVAGVAVSWLFPLDMLMEVVDYAKEIAPYDGGESEQSVQRGMEFGRANAGFGTVVSVIFWPMFVYLVWFVRKKRALFAELLREEEHLLAADPWETGCMCKYCVSYRNAATFPGDETRSGLRRVPGGLHQIDGTSGGIFSSDPAENARLAEEYVNTHPTGIVAGGVAGGLIEDDSDDSDDSNNPKN